jgi:hypothetical protein
VTRGWPLTVRAQVRVFNRPAAVFDNPELIVACVVGDGEAETGPLATAWHSNKFLDPATDGAVLPILHLKGYKISNPTLLARIAREELEQLLRGYGCPRNWSICSSKAVAGDLPEGSLCRTTSNVFAFILFFGRGRTAFIPPVNRFQKRVGSEPARPFPRFKPSMLIHDEVAKTHQFVPFQTPKALRNAGFRGCPGFVHPLRCLGRATRHVFTIFPGGFQI